MGRAVLGLEQLDLFESHVVRRGVIDLQDLALLGQFATPLQFSGCGVGAVRQVGRTEKQLDPRAEGSCTNGRTAMVAFDPTSPAIDVATGRLNIDGHDDPSDTTNAKNVQVEVTKRDGSPLNVYTEKSEGVVIADNQALIPLAAQMYASGASTEGTVKTRVGFTIVYAD